MKIREVFAELVFKIGKKDKNLIVMVGDISHGILKKFRDSFPDRYYNIGICEPSMVNLAAGLSKVGLNPVIHTIAPFLIERSYEQIKLDFGYQKLPVNIVSVGGAFDYSKLGCSHHCYADVSLLSHFKDANIVLPASEQEFKIIFSKIYKEKKINYFRLPEHKHDVEIDLKKIVFGKIVKIYDGKDVSLVASGTMLKQAKMAAEFCKKNGIDVELLYVHTLKPFDKKTILKSVKKTKKIITVEDLSAHDGLYSICLKTIYSINDVKTKQLAIKDFIHSYGSFDDLCKKSGIDVKNIIKQIKNINAKKNY